MKVWIIIPCDVFWKYCYARRGKAASAQILLLKENYSKLVNHKVQNEESSPFVLARLEHGSNVFTCGAGTGHMSEYIEREEDHLVVQFEI